MLENDDDFKGGKRYRFACPFKYIYRNLISIEIVLLVYLIIIRSLVGLPTLWDFFILYIKLVRGNTIHGFGRSTRHNVYVKSNFLFIDLKNNLAAKTIITTYVLYYN